VGIADVLLSDLEFALVVGEPAGAEQQLDCLTSVAGVLGGERTGEWDGIVSEHGTLECLPRLVLIADLGVAKGTSRAPGQDVAELIGVVGSELDFVLAERRADVGV